MRIGVVTFPGTLDDRDAQRAVRFGGHEAVALWHGEHDLQGVMRWCCRAGSHTATTCAAVRSQRTPPS